MCVCVCAVCVCVCAVCVPCVCVCRVCVPCVCVCVCAACVCVCVCVCVCCAGSGRLKFWRALGVVLRLYTCCLCRTRSRCTRAQQAAAPRGGVHGTHSARSENTKTRAHTHTHTQPATSAVMRSAPLCSKTADCVRATREPCPTTPVQCLLLVRSPLCCATADAMPGPRHTNTHCSQRVTPPPGCTACSPTHAC
jgi:hypothetical protein